MFRRSVVAALAALLVAGCTPTAPVSPSPTPTPTTYLCTPEAGGTPAPCTQAQHEEMLRMDALYAEAETVLRRYVAEVDRQYANWELRAMTPELEATTMGSFRSYEEQLIEKSRAKQLRRVNGAQPMAWIKRIPGLARDGSIVALEACEDGRAERYLDKDMAASQPGEVFLYRYFFARSGESLKITQSEFKKGESC